MAGRGTTFPDRPELPTESGSARIKAVSSEDRRSLTVSSCYSTYACSAGTYGSGIGSSCKSGGDDCDTSCYGTCEWDCGLFDWFTCDGACSCSTCTGCTACSAGTYSDSGASSCTACPEGFYQPLSGQGNCDTSCPAGYYQALSGQDNCDAACSAGTYSEAGASSCTKPSMKLVEVASIPIAGAASHCFFRLCDFTSRTEEYNKTLKKPFTEAPDGALLAVSQAGKR